MRLLTALVLWTLSSANKATNFFSLLLCKFNFKKSYNVNAEASTKSCYFYTFVNSGQFNNGQFKFSPSALMRSTEIYGTFICPHETSEKT